MLGEALVSIKDKQWNVSVAASTADLSQGLGGLTTLAAQTGELFDLGLPQIIRVTTVPMLLALDIAFLSENLEVTEVYHDIQPGYLVTSMQPARYFLEVNAGELEGIIPGDPVTLNLITPPTIDGGTDWVSTLVEVAGFTVAAILLAVIVRDILKNVIETPQKLDLLPQTGSKGKYILKMDRMGNILITHNRYPGKDVFLQFESDKEIALELLRRGERKDLEAGWPVEIADNQPRASILDELWECKNRDCESTGHTVHKRDSGTPDKGPVHVHSRISSDKSSSSSRNNPNSGRFYEGNLDYLPDSQEFLAYTIEDIGYREKIDDAFLKAIKRARGNKTW
ncbi:MAG: DUF192 domain-containing protein [Dehalococcoidales bacterium]|nr:DUF192 domain-containing protein [Dehalococcoidales bacterium]